MVAKVFKTNRCAVLVQIAGRGDQNPLVARQPPRHPLRRLPSLYRPEPDGAIKSFSSQVGQLLCELQLNVDARIAFLKSGQCRPQPEASKTKGGSQPDQTGRFCLALLQFGLQRGKTLQQHHCARAKRLAFCRRADAPRCTLKQALAQPCFECS